MMRSVALTSVIAMFAGGASANLLSGLIPKDVRTLAYSEMVSWTERDMRPAGVQEIARVDGMIFLDVRGIFDVPWSDDLSRVSISANDILLILPDGIEIKPFGSYEYWGMMHLNPAGASLSRPRDFPDEDEDLYWQSLFLVPEGTTTAILRMPNDDGLPGFEGEITVPTKISQELQAAVLAEFTVTDAALFRSLATIDGRETTRVTMTMTAPPGNVFADLEIEVAALAANEFEQDGRFYWHSYDFRLVGLDGKTFHSIGERFSDRILDWQFSSTQPNESASRRVIWMVPEGTTEATLMFGDMPVAAVTLPGEVGDQG